MTQPFLLGVNYWPRRKAMSWWGNFDVGEVREEFALIRELGLGVVRIFLLWDDWQPTPDAVSRPCLAHLAAVCDTAADLNLKLDVTFFTGHMSGPNWAPRWLLAGPLQVGARTVVSGGHVVRSGYHNPYTYPPALAAERLLLRTVVGAFKDHSAIGLWNLGNEPDLFAWPPDAPTGRSWVREMSTLIHEIDPYHPVTCGLHTDSLLRDNGLRVSDIFAETDIAVMHAYPMYANWARGPLDPDLVPFSCALTTALCGKPTLMEEFGGCTAAPGAASHVWSWEANGRSYNQFMAAEEDLATYIGAVLPRLVEVGATGALLWCFADYVPELWDSPPCDEARHERFFGLVRADGSLKPHAAVLQAFAATAPVCRTENIRRIAEPISAEDFYRNPREQTVRLYAQW
jgi:endo-1,4-beta-mannosidase